MESDKWQSNFHVNKSKSCFRFSRFKSLQFDCTCFRWLGNGTRIKLAWIRRKHIEARIRYVVSFFVFCQANSFWFRFLLTLNKYCLSFAIHLLRGQQFSCQKARSYPDMVGYPPRPFSPRHETWVPTWIKRPQHGTWVPTPFPSYLLVTSGDHHWRPVQTCSLQDPPSPTGTDIWWWPLKQVRLASGLYAPTGILSCYCQQTKFGAR